MKKIQCKICNRTYSQLANHLRNTHSITSVDYYLNYEQTEIREIPKCLNPKCNKETKFINIGDAFQKYCSKECRLASGKQIASQFKTNYFNKHGIENPMQNKDVQEKIKQTNLERYGVENARQSEVIKNKIKQTNLERYGVEHVFQSKDVQEKIKQTNLERYGVENAGGSTKSQEKIKQTNLERYGVEHYMSTVEFKDKSKNTNLERYGVDNYTKSEDYFNKYRANHRAKYWTTFKLTLKQPHLNITPLFSKDDYIKDLAQYKFQCNYCGNVFTKSSNSITPQTIHCGCLSLNNGTSNGEKLIRDEIKSFYDGEIVSNKYFSFEGKRFELDIYIPEFNLGIEHDGLYWHSDFRKSPTYHKTKTDFFNNLGIDVIHVREDEFIFKPEIIMSIIKNRMNLSKKIYGRKTIKKEIDSKTYKKFLNENHIQGAMNSKIKLGLFYEDELVAALGIGKNRFEDSLELHRFVVKTGINVVGGFSKLLKGFDNLITYCDLSHFNGNGYKTIGFETVSVTPPSYVYFKKYEILSRYQCQKHKLNAILKVYNESLTEYQNMINNGYGRIFNCGNLKLKKDKDKENEKL